MMINKLAYFEARKTDYGFQVSGTESWRANFSVLSAGSVEPISDPDVFAEWKWDESRLRVRTCPTGVVLLYCYCTPDRIVISPSLDVVTSREVPLSFDDDAMSLFLRIGFFVDNHTPFSQIKVIGPNSVFTWPDEHRSPSIYPVHKSTSWTLKQAKSAYIDLVHESVKHRLPPTPDFKMPLSGGRDSRHILLELLSFKYKPSLCFTAQIFPPWRNEEVPIAKQIADKFDIPHVEIPHLKSKVEAELRKNVLTDYCADEHSWAISMLDFIGEQCTTLYDGINAGVLFGRIGNMDLVELALKGNYSELADTLLSSSVMPENWFASSLRDSYRERWKKERAHEVLRNELSRFEHQANPIQAFYFWNRVRRETSVYSFGIFFEHNVLCPFLDRDLVKFALSLPVEISTYSDFQEEALEERFSRVLNSTIKSHWIKRNAVSKNFTRRYAAELLRYFFNHRSSEILNVDMMMRQQIRTFFNGRLASLDWIVPDTSLYTLQIEDVIRKHSSLSL